MSRQAGSNYPAALWLMTDRI